MSQITQLKRGGTKSLLEVASEALPYRTRPNDRVHANPGQEARGDFTVIGWEWEKPEQPAGKRGRIIRPVLLRRNRLSLSTMVCSEGGYVRYRMQPLRAVIWHRPWWRRVIRFLTGRAI